MGYALGIDLGTTFTGAAIVRDGRAEIVPLGNHAATIPTMVFLRDDDSVLIGDAAERRGLAEPARLAREFKRRLGDTAPIMLDRTPFSADRLLALMLRQIIADITERHGAAPDVVSVTHPANWGEFKIDLLRQAVQLAGVVEAVFLTEPVAAALQYAAGERVEPGEAVAIYDLGGGTFDAAVLRKTEGGFELLGRPQGIERLGGIDFDEAVFTHVRKVVGDVIADLDVSDPPTRAALARLRQECVLAKESLSADSEATVPVLLPNVQTQVRITRIEFEDMIRPILRETIDSLKRAIESSGMTAGQLKAVLLAGGSSRIPLIADMVRSELGRPVVTDSHPKHSVALGAARFASSVEGGALSSQAPALSAPVVQRPSVAVAPSSAPPAPPIHSVPVPSPTEPVPVVGSTAPPKSPVRAPIAVPPGGGGSDGPKRPAWLWAAAAAGVAAVVVVAILALGGGDDGGSADPGTTAAAAGETTATDSSTTATTSAISTTSTDVETGAATQLTDYLDSDRPTADALVGTYVPQLAAKYVGLDYEGVVYGPVEILDEHSLLRGAYDTILVDGGEYAFTMGEDDMDGWYLTIVPASYATKDAASQWCTDQGFDISNCFARLFMPPASSADNMECSTNGGACVGIAAAVWSADTLYVSYLVQGFDPIDCGCDGTYHVHFFFDTVPIEQAGMPGSGPWYVWDADDGGGELVFTGLTAANLGEYNYEDGASLCIAEASYDHTLTDPDTYYCFAVPSPGQ